MPSLVKVAELAILLCPFDGTIIDGGGLRTQAQAETNAAAGTGIANSRHLRQSDGWGHAIDLIALTKGKIDWNNLPAFKSMAHAVKIASAMLVTPIRQGCDWNMNGIMGEAGTKEWDWPHFEDPLPHLLKKAESEMLRFREELSREGWDLTPPNLAA
ncbi:MAG TPA: hypothetical protein VGK73_08755 [Polyangiaceae bacterium]